MQTIYQNEDERNNSGKTDLVDIIICVERVSRYMKEKYTKGLRKRIVRI